MKNPIFLVYGILVMSFSSYASFSGLTLFRPRQSAVSPKSIRDNPGAYRSTYGGYSRYTGGK